MTAQNWTSSDNERSLLRKIVRNAGAWAESEGETGAQDWSSDDLFDVPLWRKAVSNTHLFGGGTSNWSSSDNVTDLLRKLVGNTNIVSVAQVQSSTWTSEDNTTSLLRKIVRNVWSLSQVECQDWSDSDSTTVLLRKMVANLLVVSSGAVEIPPVNVTPPSISGGVAEVTDLDFENTWGNTLIPNSGQPGKYFLTSYVDDPERYCDWFSFDNGEVEPDASAQGATVYRQHNFATELITGDVYLAEQIASSLGGIWDSGTIVTITQSAPGPVEDAEDVDSGVAITVTTQGGFPVGTTLTCDDGEWTGEDTITRQWQHESAPDVWEDIAGETDPTYVVQAIYATEMIRCLVTAENAAGSTDEPSNELGPVSGLIGWFESDQIAGLSNTDPISLWEDASGSGNDFTSSGADRPLYKESIFGELPAVHVDGMGQFMDGANNRSGPLTFFLVAKFASVPGGGNIALIATDSGFSGYNFYNAGTLGIYAGSTVQTVETVGADAFVGVFVYNGASSSVRINDGTPVTGDPGTVTAAKLRIGKNSAGGEGSDLYHGAIKVFDSALDETNIGQVVAQLMTKYSITP